MKPDYTILKPDLAGRLSYMYVASIQKRRCMHVCMIFLTSEYPFAISVIVHVHRGTHVRMCLQYASIRSVSKVIHVNLAYLGPLLNTISARVLYRPGYIHSIIIIC